MGAARRKEGHEGWGEARTRAERGGWERVKGCRRPGSPSTAVHTRVVGGQAKNANIDEKPEVAQVGALDCGMSPAFPAAQTSLATCICSMLYNLYKDAYVAAVDTGHPRPALHGVSPAARRPQNFTIASRLLATNLSIHAQAGDPDIKALPGAAQGSR